MSLTLAEQHALVVANRGYVYGLARRFAYTNPGRSVDDFAQEGLMGMMRAAKQFDPARGFKFITYAGPHVLQAMMRFRDYTRALSGMGQRDRKRTNPKTEAARQSAIDARVFSFETSRRADGWSPSSLIASDQAGPEELAAKKQLADFAALIVGELPPIQRLVLEAWVNEENGKVTGARIGRSKQRVQQIRDEALDKLRSRPDVIRRKARGET